MPRTQVAATEVKNPGPRSWLIQSAANARGKRSPRAIVASQTTAYATTLIPKSRIESSWRPSQWHAMETMPVAIDMAK